MGPPLDVLERMAGFVASARDEGELSRLAVDLCLELTGLESAALAVAGQARRPEVLANRGVSEDYLHFLKQQYMNLPGAVIIGSGHPRVVADVREVPSYASFLHAYEDAGIVGMVLLPLRLGSGGAGVREVRTDSAADTELFGVLGLYHSSPLEVSEEAVALANIVATEASLGLMAFRLHREREHYKREAVLERSQEVVGTLTAGIAHDLNNVMGAVLGVMTLVPRLDPERLADLLGQLERQIVYATGLTRSLLGLSRVNRADGEPACDPEPVVRQSIEMVRASAHPDTEFIVESGPMQAVRGGCRAAIHEMTLSRILLNLLLNAVQAIGRRPGGRVIVRLDEGEGRCRIEVDDNGPGIDPEHQAQIFEPFASFNKASGTGVGLTSARGLAERSGGSLGLRSRPGDGACFLLELPVASTGNRAEAAGVERARETLRIARPRARVLIAEDEPIQRQVFADALRDAGFDVTSVADGGEARAQLEEGAFDALVLDQRMPALTGVEVLRHHRSAGGRTPALMVSGLGVDQAGVADLDRVTVVEKPISGEALVALLDRALSERSEPSAASSA